MNAKTHRSFFKVVSPPIKRLMMKQLDFWQIEKTDMGGMNRIFVG